MRKNYTYVLVSTMLFALGLQAITSMRQKSPACDEVSHHIATGYSFLKTGDFRLNSTSPPLTEEVAALPLLFLKPHLPLNHPSWDDIDRVTFGFQFLYRYNRNAEQLVFWTRIPMVVLSLLCAFLVFVFARELYGIKAGVFSMFLYIFSPNILAYSRLAIPDIGATFFILLAVYRFYKFIRKPKPKNIFLAGIALGLAEASKLSALLLLPLFLGISLWKAISAKASRYIIATFAIILICFVVVFATYFGEVKPLLKNDIDVPEKIDYINKATDKLFPTNNQSIKDKVIDFALNRPIPFATYIMNILAETNMVFVKPYPTFLMGRYSQDGWWYYYPVAFLLKTPIPALILIVLLVIFFNRVKPKDVWGERVGLLFILAFAIATFFSRLQLSIRYILPLYPFCFIYISKLVNLKVRWDRPLKVTIAVLSLWYFAGTLFIWPDYIAYFNRFADGPDGGWRYLRDANIDYGQDLPALASYLKRNNISGVKLFYSGTADPRYYGIRYQGLDKEDMIRPQREVYAISVNYIDSIKWKDYISPTAKAGYSIFIYDLRKKAIP